MGGAERPVLDRILIVGLGSIGRRHLRLARELVPGARIAALRHREGPVEGETRIDATFTSLADAVAFRPQAAVIATPATQHVGTAAALAEAGAHLLVEKPISDSSAGVSALIGACHARGLVLMTGYNLRFLPSLRRFRDLLKEERVGRVLSIRAEVGQYLPSWRPGADYRTTVSARADLGGGALLELSHEIDYLRWVFGDVVSVSAMQQRVSDLDIDVDDIAYLTLGFGPLPGRDAPAATLALDLLRHDVTRRCTVIGAGGTMQWDAVAGTVRVFEAGARAWETLFDTQPARDDSYRAEWGEFLRCIATGDSPEPSGADGLAVVRVIEAARASARAGCVTPVEHAGLGES